MFLLLFAQGQLTLSRGYSFQTPQPLETVPGLDVLPSSLQATDGTLWVVWESFRSGQPNIVARTNNGGVWSATFNVTTSLPNVDNIQPSISQLQNGTIIIVWTSNPTGTYQLYYRTYTAGIWRPPVQVTSGSFLGALPSTAVAPNGTLWLVWYRETPSAACISGLCRQVYYKTLTGNVWSGEIQLTTDATWNIDPDVMVAKDGRVLVTFTKWNTGGGGDWNVYYRTYSGTTWSGDILLTGVAEWDTTPDLSQDRNGTIWLFWAREMKLSGTIFQDKLWYKFSGNGGTTWSVDQQLTFGGTTADTIDDREPSAVQAVDKSLWVFYSSDLTDSGSDFNIHYIKTNPITPIHDVSIASIQYPPFQYRGGLPSIGQPVVLKLNLTVANLGDFDETVQVVFRASNTTTYELAKTVTLPAGTSQVFTLSLNSTNMPLGRYSLSATVSQVPGENSHNIYDNARTVANAFRVLPWGDIDQDGSVTLIDVAVVFFGFGSSSGSPTYNPLADINGTGTIDIVDAGIAAFSFGTVS